MADRNKELRDFADSWALNGDLLVCRGCQRAHIASREDEAFVHRSGCEKARQGSRPWKALVAILMMPARDTTEEAADG